MKRILITTAVIVLLIGCLLCLAVLDRYRHAVYWIEEGAFSKATSYVDEFPFFIELYEPGLVSYAYAGEAMGYGHYDEAIELLKPLADVNYRDSAERLKYCMDQADQLPN